MSVAYRAVGWNRQKRLIDLLLVLGITVFIATYMVVSQWRFPNITAETLMIRGYGLAAIFLLHIILAIGPLCRLNSKFLPWLYNRRHLGVVMFILALVHGVLSLIQFHSFGDMNPLLSLFTSNTQFDNLSGFPFQQLGFLALVILAMMAVTSHDFWLANLSAPVWKSLHMGVYLAYFLLIGHVGFGALQAEAEPLLWFPMVFGAFCLAALHLASARKEIPGDTFWPGQNDRVFAGIVGDIPDKEAKIISIAGERVAIFRDGKSVYAVSNVCVHQNGPLGEGRIIDGCITCPWHGYQYRPEDGCSPEPFTEKIPTFDVWVEGDQIFVSSQPNPAGSKAQIGVWEV